MTEYCEECGKPILKSMDETDIKRAMLGALLTDLGCRTTIAGADGEFCECDK